ncbi:MAG: aspartate-semialdehyde dehydrogenase [Gammaproteobacteria bacterium]|nr:aspartate-semialdehyde dehydrogenase [Gammaproteobacteria bacterium]
MTKRSRELVIVGVDSASFTSLLEVLEARKIIEAEQLCLLADDDTEATPQVFANRSIAVQAITEFSFATTQIVVLLENNETTKSALAAAEAAEAWVIDAAGITCGDDSTLLIHPLINTADIATAENKLISLPGAGAAMLAEALLPLADQLQTLDIILNQPVSALGKRAIDEMASQTTQMFNGQDVATDPISGQRLAFNHLSSAEATQPSGHSLSELALIYQLRHLLGHHIAIDATINTASVFHGQLANVHAILKDAYGLEHIRGLLANGAQLKMCTRPSAQDAVGEAVTLVGRLRLGLTNPHQIKFCATSDNLRKDLASNCVQIIHLLLKLH